MATQVKVFGTMGFRGGAGQVRRIVAAPSQRAAAVHFRCSVNHLRNFGSITGNIEEIRTATAQPGVVFWRPINDRNGEWHAES